MEHFIQEITIEKLRHLSDIKISLNKEKKQHLLLTGKNGSGKTSLLYAMKNYLQAINDGELNKLKVEYLNYLETLKSQLENVKGTNKEFQIVKQYESWKKIIKSYIDGVEIKFNYSDDLDNLYQNGQFITVFFPAERKTEINKAHGVEEITLSSTYGINQQAGNLLLKYMVHLKTQQSYANNEGDSYIVKKIQAWFERFTKALKILLDDESIELIYNYKEYDFKIKAKGRNPFNFTQLSDGYSSLIHMVSELILRMDGNWLLEDKLSVYDKEGIVLIDELETHLHIELQRKILPFLVEFFPNLQFIITTHSPFILNSISNAKIYDLEKQEEFEDFSAYSSSDITEGYFDTEEYSEGLIEKLNRYKELAGKDNLLEDERAERAMLHCELKNLSKEMAGTIRNAFEEIEHKKKG